MLYITYGVLKFQNILIVFKKIINHYKYVLTSNLLNIYKKKSNSLSCKIFN